MENSICLFNILVCAVCFHVWAKLEGRWTVERWVVLREWSEKLFSVVSCVFHMTTAAASISAFWSFCFNIHSVSALMAVNIKNSVLQNVFTLLRWKQFSKYKVHLLTNFYNIREQNLVWVFSGRYEEGGLGFTDTDHCQSELSKVCFWDSPVTNWRV